MENEQLRHKMHNIKREEMMYDARAVQHAKANDFEQYVKRNFKKERKTNAPDAAAAAQDIIARGLAHGRR